MAKFENHPDRLMPGMVPICLFCGEVATQLLSGVDWPEPIPKGAKLALCEKCINLTPMQIAEEVRLYVNELREEHNRSVLTRHAENN